MGVDARSAMKQSWGALAMRWPRVTAECAQIRGSWRNTSEADLYLHRGMSRWPAAKERHVLAALLRRLCGLAGPLLTEAGSPRAVAASQAVLSIGRAAAAVEHRPSVCATGRMETGNPESQAMPVNGSQSLVLVSRLTLKLSSQPCVTLSTPAGRAGSILTTPSSEP